MTKSELEAEWIARHGEFDVGKSVVEYLGKSVVEYFGSRLS